MENQVDTDASASCIADAPKSVSQEQLDAVYKERNALVCALSKVFPSYLMEHPKDDASWDPEWRTIVCINGPNGQMTWHIHSSELRDFERHLPWSDVNDWDGHTTEEKYRRLANIPLFEIVPATYRTFTITGIDPVVVKDDAQMGGKL